MNTIIITGGSKGLGKSLTQLYAKKGYVVYSLARSIRNNSDNVTHIPIDLSDLNKATRELNKILDDILAQSPESITLINNAGTLGKMDVLKDIPLSDIQATISINYITPMTLSSVFSKRLENYSGIKKIRNISSGAANGAYHGWSVYCSTKAAMDSFSRVLAVEQMNETNPVHVLSIYPGVIDTGMQAEVRNTSKKEFSNVERFRQMKQNNDLSSPEEISELIYQIDKDENIENGSITDVRDFV